MHRRRPPTNTDIFDRIVNAIASTTLGTALGAYGAVVATALAITFVSITIIMTGPTFNRADPSGLISGNPSDVVLGDSLLTVNSDGLSALCPAPNGELNFCDFVTSTNDQLTIINARLNITNRTAISASSVGYSGSTPYYTVAVTDVNAALDDLSVRYYDVVLNFSLTSSRFPALTFPTDQSTVNEDIGRRLRIIETTPSATNITSLPAANISYTPAVPSNWSPAPTQLQASTDQLAARVKTLELTPFPTLTAYNITYNGYTPLFTYNLITLGDAVDDLSTRYYNKVLNISLTPSRFPALTFPTDQLTVDEDIGRRLRLLETSSGITIPATNVTYSGAPPGFTTTVTNADAALSDLSGMRVRKDNNYYLSASYGNDVTCDGSRFLPCASIYRTLQLLPNTTNQFAQYSFLFDNGLYVESNFTAIKPNILFVANEIGVLLIFNAGAGLDGGSWAATGAGYVSFLRFGLLRCSVSCDFDMSAAVPAAATFSVFRFYNTSMQLTVPMSFRRRADTTSYFSVIMESVVVDSNSITFQDLTSVTWDLSGDVYAALIYNYNSTSTYASGIPVVSISGLIGHAANSINNYAAGVTVDAALLGYVQKDAATFTVVTVTGTTVNTHGDVLSYGVINGGILYMGAGSTTFQYLTLATGLGYVPTTSSDWNAPVPVNQQQANDQLASRTKTLEGLNQQYVDTQYSESGSGVNSPLTLLMTTGNEIVVGPSYFLRTAGGLKYNASTGHGFEFRGVIPLSVTSAGSITLVLNIDLVKNAGIGTYPLIYTILGATTYTNTLLVFPFSTYINLVPNDILTLFITFSGGGGTTAFVDNTPANYFTFKQVT